MDTVKDFEDMLALFERFEVQYLIIGGLAFIFHAKPRYTKDMDLWVGPSGDNVDRANEALTAFGSSQTLDPDEPDEILQIGVAPNRIDLLRTPDGITFQEAWNRRIKGRYGSAGANWIDLGGLISIKSAIDHPRHQDDARILRLVRDSRLEQ